MLVNVRREHDRLFERLLNVNGFVKSLVERRRSLMYLLITLLHLHRGHEFDGARVVEHLLRRHSIQMTHMALVCSAAHLARRAGSVKLTLRHTDHLRRRRDCRSREVAIVVEFDSDDLRAVAHIVLVKIVVE